MNPASWLSLSADRLRASASPSPDVEVALLLCHVLGISRVQLRQAPPLTDEQVATLEGYLLRRISGEPLQYVTGYAPFRYLNLRVGQGVLIPRPETELLVDAALMILASKESAIAVDLGAGAGPIAISLATESTAEVYAVESEAEAFRWLTENISEHAPAVRAVNADVQVALPELEGRVDLVVANPPYLPDYQRDTLHAEVVDHEPAAALWGHGVEGTEVPQLFIAAAARLLAPGGHLVMEHDARQQEQILHLMSPIFDRLSGHKDLAGRPRWVKGVKR
jgi:release factor glutamine methyltransferase